VAAALAVVRVLTGALFVCTGILKLVRHDLVVPMFARWHVPSPGAAVTIVGAIELVCGLLLALGILTRSVALVLATVMVGAVWTAGRVDGGIHVVAPPVLFVLCVAIAWRSGRFPSGVPARRPGVQ
jgi:uncharacterized membrane protein YphA (DoxX/SURF4 family)